MLAFRDRDDSQYKTTMLNMLKARGIKEDISRRLYALHQDYNTGKYYQRINKDWVHNS